MSRLTEQERSIRVRDSSVFVANETHAILNRLHGWIEHAESVQDYDALAWLHRRLRAIERETNRRESERVASR